MVTFSDVIAERGTSLLCPSAKCIMQPIACLPAALQPRLLLFFTEKAVNSHTETNNNK